MQNLISLSLSLSLSSKLFAAKSSMEEGFVEEDLMSSSAASSRRESSCSTATEGEGGGKWRRRSSTSDALRFRQRMRQASGHESHEEIPNHQGDAHETSSTSSAVMTGATEKGGGSEARRREPEIMITAASVSSQESADTPKSTTTKAPSPVTGVNTAMEYTGQTSSGNVPQTTKNTVHNSSCNDNVKTGMRAEVKLSSDTATHKPVKNET